MNGNLRFEVDSKIFAFNFVLRQELRTSNVPIWWEPVWLSMAASLPLFLGVIFCRKSELRMRCDPLNIVIVFSSCWGRWLAVRLTAPTGRGSSPSSAGYTSSGKTVNCVLCGSGSRLLSTGSDPDPVTSFMKLKRYPGTGTENRNRKLSLWKNFLNLILHQLVIKSNLEWIIRV